MREQKIIAFDIMGPLYHFDGEKGWNPKTGAAKTLMKKLEKLDYNLSSDLNIVISEKNLIKNKEAKMYINPGFVESVQYALKRGGLPILISTGLQEGFELVLEEAVRDYYERTRELITPNDLFAQEHRHTTVNVGSKKDSATWNKIVTDVYGNSSNVLATYEDTFANMQAAMKGLDCMGFHVVAQKNGICRVSPTIYRGTMQELIQPLKKVM